LDQLYKTKALSLFAKNQSEYNWSSITEF
jgi:hypothetical protein